MYNTNNPVEPNGSSDPRDIGDNAQVLDLLLNSDKVVVTGRTGKQLKGIAALKSIITSLDLGSFTFADIASGLAGTTTGQFFRVVISQSNGGDIAWSIYQNNAGSAVFITSVANTSKLDRIQFDGSQDSLLNIVDSDGNLAGVFYTKADGTLGFRSKTELTSDNGFGGDGYTMSSTVDFSLVLTDSEGNVSYLVNNDGSQVSASSTGGSTNTDIVAELTASAGAQSYGASVIRFHHNQAPSKKLNMFISYGQSYSNGSDSERTLTLSAYDGCVMLGGTTYGTWGNNGAFSPTGSAVFKPLIASEKESHSVGMVNELKRLRNRAHGVASDTDHLYGSMELGIGSRSIQQCIDGDAWGRFTTGIDLLVTTAASAGYKFCIAGLINLQGENDVGQTYDYYYGKLGELKDKINAYIVSKIPDNANVDFYLSQTGAAFAGPPDAQNIPKAQMDFCRDNFDVHFMGPYQHLQATTQGIHLVANSYRWYGANAAKVINRVLSGQEQTIFRMNQAKHSGSELYVSFNVPCPPISFGAVYVNKTATTFADKGFTVTDSSGSLSGSSLTVSIVSPNTIKISCSRTLTGAVTVTLGDKSIHNGRHNICDSDPSVSYYKWEVGSDTTAPDYIPDLNGKAYPLKNWAGLDRITSEAV